MMYGSLAARKRPTTFEDVCGQNIITKILSTQLKNKTFRNAYGFFGNSGCGKTTCARIFANEINSGVGEPIEIDGASAGNVDTIRALIDSANQRSLTGEYKVIIIDECQMLGGGRKENSPAWSALLKTIEEAPKYTIFILCSTNPEKIPEAILNRVQRFNFGPIPANEIKNRLISICKEENFTNYELACDFISRTCNGCMREAITNLERCADYSTDLNIENVKVVLSGLSFESMFKLTWALQQKNQNEVISIIESLYSDGQDLKAFINMYLDFTLDLSKYILFNSIDITNIPEYLSSNENPVVQFTVKSENSLEYFNKLTEAMLEIKSAIKNDMSYKSTIIVMMLKFMRNN